MCIRYIVHTVYAERIHTNIILLRMSRMQSTPTAFYSTHSSIQTAGAHRIQKYGMCTPRMYMQNVQAIIVQYIYKYIVFSVYVGIRHSLYCLDSRHIVII